MLQKALNRRTLYWNADTRKRVTQNTHQYYWGKGPKHQ